MGFVVGIGQAVHGFFELHAGHFVQIRFAAQTFQPQRQMVAHAQRDARRGGAQQHFALDAVFRLLFGNAPVGHVAHAGGRCRSIKQRRRTAHQFDLLGQQGIGGHGVIGRNRRHIHHVRAVLQHFHPHTLLPAYHRRTRATAERIAVHPALARQSVAQSGRTRVEFFAVDHHIAGLAPAAQRQGLHGFAFAADGNLLQGLTVAALVCPRPSAYRQQRQHQYFLLKHSHN